MKIGQKKKVARLGSVPWLHVHKSDGLTMIKIINKISKKIFGKDFGTLPADLIRTVKLSSVVSSGFIRVNPVARKKLNNGKKQYLCGLGRAELLTILKIHHAYPKK